MNFYEIPFGKNNWCGPAALAYVLRTDPDTAAAEIRKAGGRTAIKATYATEISGVLTANLVPYAPITGQEKTLNQWLKWVDIRESDEYLVFITGHFIVVHGERYFDNRCHFGNPLSFCPYLKKRVVRAWKIEKK